MAVITNPITGETASAFNPADVIGLAYKCSQSIITGADITLKYPQFETTLDQWGGFIEEARIPATESHAVNKTGTAIAHYYFDLDAQYFQDWTEKQYTKEIRRTDAMKVLRGEMEFSDLVAKIVTANVEGYRNETNIGVAGTFSRERVDGSSSFNTLLLANTEGATLSEAFKSDTEKAPNQTSILTDTARTIVLGSAETPATYEQIFSEIMFRCKDMTFPNSRYTIGENVYGANMSDLCIVAPIDFLSNASIEFISKLYNLSEIGKLPEIIETDVLATAYNSGTYEANAIIIMDKRVVRHVVKEFEIPEPTYNRASRSDYFDLNVVDMIRPLPFYKAWAIIFDSTNR